MLILHLLVVDVAIWVVLKASVRLLVEFNHQIVLVGAEVAHRVFELASGHRRALLGQTGHIS